MLTKKEKQKRKRDYYISHKIHIQKYREINKDKIKQRKKQYRLTNKEKLKEKRKEAHLKNPEKSKEYYNKHKDEINKYLIEHKNELKEKRKKYYQKYKNRAKEYYRKNRDKILKQRKQYQKTFTGKIIAAKIYSKRQRELGFQPLNDYFENSNAHHLDKKNVIHIPSKLHKVYCHRQNNEESMKNINLKAWDFMESQSY